MPAPPKLEYDTIYHIWNRGVNRTNIFVEDENYRYFLRTYIKHIEPVAVTYAYCLQPNHFHLVVRTRPRPQRSSETSEVLTPSPSQAFSNFFNAYVRAFNRRNQRSGGLFEGRFGRKPVYDAGYLMRLITYVHQNPQLHGLIDDFRDWPYSSYGAYTIPGAKTRVRIAPMLKMFEGKENFIEMHASLQTSEVFGDL